MRWGGIKVSSRTTHLFAMLRTSTGMGHDVLARFALCLSLGQRGMPNPDEYNAGGSTLVPSEVFGADEGIYMALLIDRLREDGLDPVTYLGPMSAAHINRGAISLKQRVSRASDLGRLAPGGD